MADKSLNEAPLTTPDGRYIVVRGRLWRRSNPDLSEATRNDLVHRLMGARRNVATAMRCGDHTAEQVARAAVNDAKVALGERGPPWWHDDAPDFNRHLARKTPYARWYETMAKCEVPLKIAIGTAGWSIPRANADAFSGEGTHLQRYARVLSVAEINSSFYGPHRRGTYERWATSTPAAFRFAAKLPRAITHEQRLIGADPLLDAFVEQSSGLGRKFAVVLVQLPPSLAFDADTVTQFFTSLRQRLPDACRVVCEPRHASWFCARAEDILSALQVARAGADPAVVDCAGEPGGWAGFRYRRLHGSPHLYRSAYGAERLAGLAAGMAADHGAGVDSWCIFDNTASGAAMADALDLQSLLGERAR